MTSFEAVIGLEVHVQLLTKTKMFCSCETSFGAQPNSHVCPVCLGLPGALPVVNRSALAYGVRAALALGLTVHETSIFARKNYFYPDLPKGYQISQYDRPFSTGGFLDIELEQGEKKRAGITRIHFEEDAGKNLHGQGGDSVVDLNRAGTPLIEIVGEPDLRSGAEAAAYLRALREILVSLGINDGNLEEGSFRCDANVSVRPVGSEKFGTRCEIKNVNSFRFVQKAIEYEVARQIAVIEGGGRVRQETRGWNEKDGKTFTLRSKEEAHDYRYFPDPDLPPLVLDAAFVQAQREALTELPKARRERYVSSFGLPLATAVVLTSHPRIAEYFDSIVGLGVDAKKAANFVTSEVLAATTTTGLTAEFPASAAHVAELLKLVEVGTISGKQAKEVYGAVVSTKQSPAEIVKERGLAVNADAGAIEAICKKVVDDNAKQVAAYRSGKTGLLGYFVGAVMKETKGSADPALVNSILKKLLEG
ncbi:MAG: Asp-tRNA(Asn)/Glu-tRNA(Gln) amidotransferase subunit GatB [Polyangiaceae bacterium]